MGAVFVLYLLVARHFGRTAGLLAALALALSPVSVAVNRDNNPDALFALLLVAAAWAGARAIESGRLRFLLVLGRAGRARLRHEDARRGRRRPRARARLRALRPLPGAGEAAAPARRRGDARRRRRRLDRRGRAHAGRRPPVCRLDERQRRLQPSPGLQRARTRHRAGGRDLHRRRPGRGVLGNARLLPAAEQRARRPGGVAAAARDRRRRLRVPLRRPPAAERARGARRARPLVPRGRRRLQLLERDHPHLLPLGARAGDQRARRHRGGGALPRRPAGRPLGGAAAARGRLHRLAPGGAARPLHLPVLAHDRGHGRGCARRRRPRRARGLSRVAAARRRSPPPRWPRRPPASWSHRRRGRRRPSPAPSTARFPAPGRASSAVSARAPEASGPAAAVQAPAASASRPAAAPAAEAGATFRRRSRTSPRTVPPAGSA